MNISKINFTIVVLTKIVSESPLLVGKVKCCSGSQIKKQIHSFPCAQELFGEIPQIFYSNSKQPNTIHFTFPAKRNIINNRMIKSYKTTK